MSDPRFEGVSTEDVAALLLVCAKSDDASDKEFAQACLAELKIRKPGVKVICVGDRPEPQKG